MSWDKGSSNTLVFFTVTTQEYMFVNYIVSWSFRIILLPCTFICLYCFWLLGLNKMLMKNLETRNRKEMNRQLYKESQILLNLLQAFFLNRFKVTIVRQPASMCIED